MKLGINAPESQLELSTGKSQLLVIPDLSFPAHLPTLDPHHHRGYVLPGVPIQSVTSSVFPTRDLTFSAHTHRPWDLNTDALVKSVPVIHQIKTALGRCLHWIISSIILVYSIGLNAMICSPFSFLLLHMESRKIAPIIS